MDSFSHAAWGATIVRKNPLVWWAALAGALPDIITFLYGVTHYKKRYKAELDILLNQVGRQPNSYMKVYYFTHSLIPISVVTAILYFISPILAVVAIPYYLHILLDVPTHTGIWATRLLYPFSDWHFKDGHDWWRNKWISIGNWTALVAVNVIIFVIK